MSDSKKVALPCKHGAECAYRKAGKCKFEHVEAKRAAVNPKVKHVALKMSGHEVLAMAKSLSKRLAMFASASAAATQAPAPPKGWALVPDSKAAVVSPGMADALNDAYLSELKVAKGILASMYGTKAVPFRLPVLFDFSSTVTTGIVSAGAMINVATAGEFASLALLFDEYRMLRGKYRFAILTPTNTIVLATSSLTDPAMFSIGFDPADGTDATAVTDVVALQYHMQVAPRIVATPTVGTYVGVYGRQDNQPFELEWRYATNAAVTGNGGVVAPGMWKSTQGNVANFPDGYIKPYYASGETTVRKAVVGTMYWDVEFRCRT